MTQQLNKKEILDSYLLHIDKISFLKTVDQENVTNYIGILNDDTKSIEDHLKAGVELWKMLFKKALLSLTGELQDTKKIFEYFNSFIDFEPILFGMDDFYRDHTLHSLWVYFVGEYLLKTHLLQISVKS